MGSNLHTALRPNWTIAVLCLTVLLAAVLPAQQPSATQALPPGTTPTRAARLTFFAGSVDIGRIDNTAASEPVPNRPLVEGSRIATGDYGQAEIEFEDGSLARLTPRSVLTLTQLSVSNGVARTELDLLAGLAFFELRQSALATYTVDAQGTRLTPLKNLTVRIGLDHPPAAFALFIGSATIDRPGDFSAELHAGESLRGIADGAKPYFRTDLIVPETWDAWNAQRDQTAAGEADQRTSAREPFAGAQGYGWSDLDNHGTWYTLPGTVPELVWQPENADEGFDPYGFGNWVLLNTGYVWASGYSWGWTPFHCGAWQYFGGFGWGWTPNNLCGRWGFGGGLGGIFLSGRHPGRFPPVLVPQPGHVHPKPLIPVRGPDGPRPAFQRGSPAQIAGRTVAPLPTLQTRSFPPSENPTGQSLLRDFPINPTNHQPIFGPTSSHPAHSPVILNGSVPMHMPTAVRSPFTPGISPGSSPTPPRPYLPAPAPRPILTAPNAPIRSTPPPPPMRPPSPPPPTASRPKT